jgi:hypothetical protein
MRLIQAPPLLCSGTVDGTGSQTSVLALVLDAQMHADYYRTRIACCEEVLKKGIEQVSDERKGQHESSPPLRPGLKLTATQ